MGQDLPVVDKVPAVLEEELSQTRNATCMVINNNVLMLPSNHYLPRTLGVTKLLHC